MKFRIGLLVAVFLTNGAFGASGINTGNPYRFVIIRNLTGSDLILKTSVYANRVVLLRSPTEQIFMLKDNFFSTRCIDGSWIDGTVDPGVKIVFLLNKKNIQKAGQSSKEQ